MMCQSMGLLPISAIGLGRTALSSLMRVPNPPARITTFIGSFSPSPRALPQRLTRHAKLLTGLVLISIQLERLLVVLSQRRILLLFAEIAVTNCEHLDFRSHETAKRILWSANNWLAAYIEAGIHDHRTARESFKRANQGVVAWIGVLMDGLNASRIIHMRHRRDVRTWHVKLLNTEKAPVALVSSASVGVRQHQPLEAYRGCRSRVRTNRLPARAAPMERRAGTTRDTSP